MLDTNSPAVARLLADIHGEINRAHVALERLGKTPAEYDVLRGRIKALRQVVTLITGKEEPNLDG